MPALQPKGADSLAFAVIAASNSLVVLLDDKLKVVAASDSFFRTFKIDPASGPGRPVFELGSGEWRQPQLRALLSAAIAGPEEVDGYEMELDHGFVEPRRLVLSARKLDHGDEDQISLLLAVSDVTEARREARLKENLLHEKAILFQEFRHRMANNLQIIASIMMQSARRVSSAETRSHLFDAHSRLMAVAALQRHLSVSNGGVVDLPGYFTDLCENIAASMIDDPTRLTLKVEADDSIATEDVAVSLGLIVTELVINALKHAFPEDKPGVILVGYRCHGLDWTLSVSDDGVGMADGREPAPKGLGSEIVAGLGRRLHAEVSIAGADRGTKVSVTHKQIAAPRIAARQSEPAAI